MTGRVFAVLMLLPALLSAAPATRPGDEVASLVARLSSEQWRERQSAQERLIEIGPEAEAYLGQVRAVTKDEDLRTSLDTILNRIDEGRRHGPSRLTVHFKDAPIRAVLDEIGRQAGVALQFEGEGRAAARTVSVDAERAPFWEVMRKVLPGAGRVPEVNGESGGVRLEEGVWQVDRSIIAGPLLVVAGTATRNSVIDFGESNEPQRSLWVELEFYVDPNLKVMRYSASPRISEAVDENGASLVDTNAEVEGPTAAGGGHPLKWDAEVELKEGPKRGRRLASLKGVVDLVVRSRSEAAELGDVLRASNVAMVVGGQKFVLNQVRASGDTYTVSLTVLREGMGRNDWRAVVSGQALRQHVKLMDAEGKLLPAAGVNPGNPRDVLNQVTMATYTFQRPRGADRRPLSGEPARLVIEVTTEVRTLTIPFELTDIALP